MSDSDNVSDAGEGSSGSVKKRKYGQCFKNEWENLTDFKGWLTSSRKGNDYGYCKCCAKDIKVVSGKDALFKHKKSTVHQDKSRSLSRQPGIRALLSDVSANKKLESDVKEGMGR